MQHSCLPAPQHVPQTQGAAAVASSHCTAQAIAPEVCSHFPSYASPLSLLPRSTFPKREELLRSLLNADLIGFHTFDYARHFLSACSRMLGLEHETSRGSISLDYYGRNVGLKIMPTGAAWRGGAGCCAALHWPFSRARLLSHSACCYGCYV